MKQNYRAKGLRYGFFQSGQIVFTAYYAEYFMQLHPYESFQSYVGAIDNNKFAPIVFQLFVVAYNCADYTTVNDRRFCKIDTNILISCIVENIKGLAQSAGSLKHIIVAVGIKYAILSFFPDIHSHPLFSIYLFA